MRYYLDTEFYEHGYARIDLISIGLVCEDGREFYAVAGDGWEPKQCSPWIRDNVIPFLPTDGHRIEFTDVTPIVWGDEEGSWDEVRAKGVPVMSREEIAREVRTFMDPKRIFEGGAPVSPDIFTQTDRQHMKPEVWGYFSDYDWVLFCQLFGRMIDLPEHFPKYCLDLKQEMRRLDISRAKLPPQKGTEHNALADARYLREVHKLLIFADEQQRAELIMSGAIG